MIKITLKSGIYTKKQLDKLFSNVFEDQRDINLFIEAMLETNQLTKKRDNYIVAETKKIKLVKPKKYSISTYYYGGQQRVGVRGGTEWVTKHGYPSNMYIDRVYKKGKWIKIKEKKQLPLVKGRGYDAEETVEKWRAQIPIDIQQKYDIGIGTPVEVVVVEETYDYYTTLQLWGYLYRVMLGYGETKDGANIRFLELDGNHFINQTTKTDLTDIITREQKRIKNIMLTLLSKEDSEYYGLYNESETDNKTSENVSLEPLKTKRGFITQITLNDLANSREIIKWYTYEEQTQIPKTTDFIVVNNVNQGITNARGQTTLGLRWNNKGGF